MRAGRLGWASAGLLMVLVAGVPGRGAADPIALRLPSGDRAEIVFAGGWPQQSAGVWFNEHLGVAAEVRLPLASVGASLGTRKTLARGRKGWGLEVFAAGGFLSGLADPGAVVTATFSVRGGVEWKGIAVGVGIATPLALRVGGGAFPVQGKVPVLLEIYGGVTIGRTLVGISVSGGLVVSTDAGFGNTAAATLWVALPLGTPGGAQIASAVTW